MIQTPPRTILEVFESLPKGTLAQVINNNLIMTPSPDFWHQDLVTEIATQIRIYLKENPIGRVIVSPIDVYFGWNNVYQPDIVFLTNEQMAHIQDGKIQGAPALIVEVLSPGTEKYDRKEKKDVYEQSGVKEYWMLDPVSRKADGYQLLNNIFIQLPPQEAALTSPLLGATIHF
jgi:Uma2 family endonuclease